MEVVTRGVSGIGFLMKFLLITVSKKVSDSFIENYDNAPIKRENRLVWHKLLKLLVVCKLQVNAAPMDIEVIDIVVVFSQYGVVIGNRKQ